MGIYTKTGPFTSGAAPGIDASFLNNMETCISTGGMMYFINPFSFSSNGSLPNGTLVTFTAWGSGGIPSGALAVFLNAFYTPSAAGTYAWFAPHGTAWNNGNYPIVGTAANNTNICAGSFLVPLDTSAGKFDVKSVNGNCTGFYIQTYAYVM